jgi:hypothetical protein
MAGCLGRFPQLVDVHLRASRYGGQPSHDARVTRPANRSRERSERLAKVGGGSGIRTPAPPVDSVSYRFHNAGVAVNANDAVAPCPLLPARMRFGSRALLLVVCVRSTGAQGTRLPFGACPGSKNVLINAPSPHTVTPEKRLYHSPSGTSGSVSSHVASSSSCVAGIFRL